MDEQKIQRTRRKVKECLNVYYNEDKIILMDMSLLQLTCISYYIYNLIFFGNKVIIPKTMYEELKRIRYAGYKTKKEDIIIKNANYILQAVENDTYQNYVIIDIYEKESEKEEQIANFLIENKNCIYYISDQKLCRKFEEIGLRNQVMILEPGMTEISPYDNKSCKFETIGAIKYEDGKMIVEEKVPNVVIKIYNSKCVEKEQGKQKKEVKERDFVLIIGKSEEKYSFNFFEIVSRHSRNNAIRIIWTTLEPDEKTNMYIEELPYEYQKIIKDNISC